MKLKQSNTYEQELDFDELIKDLMAKHGAIFFAEIDGLIFIYKPLGRKEYKTIIGNPNLTPLDIEDAICSATVLWPLDFDPEDCEAGIPSELYVQILNNSFLNGVDDMISLIEVCREETEQLDIQMSCIISEAFPKYDIEEIESWDMIKFIKIYSRAEWKIKNLRSLELNTDIIDFLKTSNINMDSDEEQESENENNYVQQTNNNNINSNVNKETTNSNKIKVGSKEMTPQEYQQYLEFRQKFPEMNLDQDAMFTGGDSMGFSSVPTPLRVR